MIDKIDVFIALRSQGVVPVFFHPDPEVCIEVISACARAGAPCVEFTNRGDFAPSIFHEVSRHFAGKTGGPRPVLGVGSIVDAPTAALYIASAARFVVGPVLNAEVARLCHRRRVPHALGCDLVKVFPGESVGGPDFVKAVLGPMPWTRIMPTGGVDPDEASVRAWFGAGIVAAGMGSKLITKAHLDARDWAGIEASVRACVELIARVRG
jgi:2-dehydro-3-deoxyphosphogluconate aldolase / (4S)-4-hydroxy-2-oxoglutarate aldolase